MKLSGGNSISNVCFTFVFLRFTYDDEEELEEEEEGHLH